MSQGLKPRVANLLPKLRVRQRLLMMHQLSPIHPWELDTLLVSLGPKGEAVRGENVGACQRGWGGAGDEPRNSMTYLSSDLLAFYS
jgi:hypothetical protein